MLALSLIGERRQKRGATILYNPPPSILSNYFFLTHKAKPFFGGPVFLFFFPPSLAIASRGRLCRLLLVCLIYRYDEVYPGFWRLVFFSLFFFGSVFQEGPVDS